eukprot:3033159-Rhodomonas_salina.8
MLLPGARARRAVGGSTHTPMVLRACYAMSGTEIACVAVWYCAGLSRYALATPCPVLTCAMLLPAGGVS